MRLTRRALAMTTLAGVAWTFIAKAATSAAAKDVDRRLTVVVAPIIVDDSIKSRLPPAFSPSTLRRELEIALDSTQLLSVIARDHHELDAVLDEMVTSHRHSARAIVAQYVIAATVEDVTLGEWRRQAPRNRGQVLVSMTGSMSLRLTVLRAADGAVKARMPIDQTWSGRDRLDDWTPGDSFVSHVDGGPGDFVALCQAVSRAVATRVLAQLVPVIVVQRDGEEIYLSRGEDAGYETGQTLRIIRQGDEIRHPVTGQVLGRRETVIGEAKVTEIQPRLTIAKIVSSTEEVQTGAIVREDLPPETQQP